MPRSLRAPAKTSINNIMASAVPKIGPTLRASGGGTAGALTGGQVGARRLKKVVETDVIKVSNNFRML